MLGFQFELISHMPSVRIHKNMICGMYCMYLYMCSVCLQYDRLNHKSVILYSQSHVLDNVRSIDACMNQTKKEKVTYEAVKINIKIDLRLQIYFMTLLSSLDIKLNHVNGNVKSEKYLEKERKKK